MEIDTHDGEAKCAAVAMNKSPAGGLLVIINRSTDHLASGRGSRVSLESFAHSSPAAPRQQPQKHKTRRRRLRPRPPLDSGRWGNSTF